MSRPSHPRSPRSARRAVVAVSVVVALVATGCGIPIGRSPTAIAKADVPFHLLDPVTSTTGPGLPPAVGLTETVYMVAQNQHLAPVSRDVRFPANLTDILGALIDGPTQAESNTGLQSFLTPKTTVTATVSNGIATIDFSTDPIVDQVVGDDQTLAIAQVVFTATAEPSLGVNGVVFEIAGQPITVPTGTGTEVPGPVSRSTYGPQAPLG